MKMMSSTRTTSTKGVTLISARLPVPPRRLRDPKPLPPLTEIAMASFSEAAFRQVQKLHGKVVHARAHFADLLAENVVEDGCRNGGDESDGCGNQRFRNARPESAQAGCALRSESLKGLNDAQHRAQQPDKRGHRRSGRQLVHITFQLGDLLADAELQGTLQ